MQCENYCIALYRTENHLLPTMSFLMQYHTLPCSFWLKNNYPCICYSNKDNNNLLLQHIFPPKSLSTSEQTIPLVFIRTQQSRYIEINGHKRWIKGNILTWRVEFLFISVVWARNVKFASWIWAWNSPKISNIFSMISQVNA